MKQFKLPKEFAEKWITALRSGEYKQGESMLQSFKEEYADEEYDDLESTPETCNYCCLGVAAYISGIPADKLHTEWIVENWRKVPIEIVGSIGKLPNILSSLNDGLTLRNYKELLENDTKRNLEEFVFRHFDIYQEFTIKCEVKLDFNQIADFIEDNCEFYEVETIKN